MKKIGPWLRGILSATVFVAIGFDANSIGLRESLLDLRLRDQIAPFMREPSCYPSTARFRLQERFVAPICYEWPYVDDRRRQLDEPEFPYVLAEDTTLAEAVGEIVAYSDGMLRAIWIQDSLSLMAADDTHEQENLLDSVVSLELRDASIWDAIKSLAIEINRRSNSDRRLRVGFSAFDVGLPPAEILTIHTITLSVEEVTAREALATIIANAPLVMSYKYYTAWSPDLYPDSMPSAQLTFDFFGENAWLCRRWNQLDVGDIGDSEFWWGYEFREIEEAK